jgi:hypothetical protein
VAREATEERRRVARESAERKLAELAPLKTALYRLNARAQ